jgi:transcriptional regulator with XRE-family HTH domain
MLRRMNRIKYFRVDRGLTQQELALAIGSKQSDVSRFERTGYRPNTRTLEKVARALNVPVADLL